MPKVAVDCTILRARKIAGDVSEVVIHAPTIAAQALPGQFVHLKVSDGEPLLRRPISISDADAVAGTLTLLYRIVGKGTALLDRLTQGAVVNCVGPLGNGFDIDVKNPLLIGGGMGIAPLIFLARQCKQKGAHTTLLLGGKNKAEMFWPELFQDFAAVTFITTDDGSLGEKGFTVSLLPKLLKECTFDRIFVCGPQVMMESAARLADEAQVSCQVSLEKHMACGIGACLSCTCEAKDGGKRRKVCTDGPVFWAAEVL